jgi:putative Mn2+ efflux pump MntP
VLALLLVAGSVGLSNLAAAIGIGLGGVTVRTRVRVALVFGALEAGMPIVGLVIGAAAGRRGEQLGGVILVAVGVAIAAGVL